MPKSAQNDPTWPPKGPQFDQSSTKTQKNAIRNRCGKTLPKNYRNRIALDPQNCVFVQEGSQKSLMPPIPKKVPKRDAKGDQNGAFGPKNLERSLSERCSKSVSEKIRKLVAMVSKKAPKRACPFPVGDVFWPPFSALEACGPKDANSLDFVSFFNDFS